MMSERARLWLIVAVAMMLLPAHAVAADEQKQVLVVYSTRRDTQVAIVGDRELPRVLEAGLSRKLDYYSEYIDGARFPDPEYRTAFHDYIKLKYRGTQFDLVVAVQDAALDFVTKYRQDLFAETPVVFEASRRAADAAPDATGIVTEFDFRQTLTLATALQPETADVFVVTGASARDKAYEQMARAQFRSFEPRLAFVYLSGLTAGELDRRMSTLPKRSIVFYLLFYQTGDGENVNPLAYLDHLAAVSNRPIYSWVDSTMDHGVVGGAMASIPSRIEALAGVALRVLHGEPAHSIPVVTAANLSVSQVDWRQLQRWRIRPSLVPAGTAILFRDPGVWGRYRTYIVSVLVLLLTQSALITGLLVQVVRRRRAEEEIRSSQRELRASYDRIRDLSGRLLTAHDAERTGIARELYDDISQQTALLLLELQMLSDLHNTSEGGAAERFAQVLERGQHVARRLHDLSHRLHPAKLGLMGLVPALHGLQREFTCTDVAVTLSCDDEVAAVALPPELTLTIYRAVQEGIRNAVRHSGAADVLVELRAAPGALFLTMSDNGVGFDVNAQWGKGLGLISMRERVAGFGGTLNIRAVPGGGTRLEISVPCDVMQEQASNVVPV